MNPLTAIFLGVMLWLAGPASGDIAMVFTEGKKDTLFIVKYQGPAPQGTECTFTFTSGKIVVAEGGKQIGQVALTADEQAEVERYCEHVRDVRRKTGGGANAILKDGKERSGMGKRHRIGRPEESNAVVLPFADFKKRAAKEHQNSVESGPRK